MPVCIREYIRQSDIDLKETVYSEEKKEILDYQMVLGDFLTFEKGDYEPELFVIRKQIKTRMKAAKSADELLLIIQDNLETISELIRIIKESDNISLYRHLKGARQIKKTLLTFYEEQIRALERQCVKEYLGRKEGITGKLAEEIIWYKKTACLTTLRNLSSFLEPLSRIKAKELHRTPLFVSGMEQLQEAVGANRPIGVEGGPCLFGYDEMEIEVVHKDGSVFYFDFAGPRYYEAVSGKREELGEHIQNYGPEIADICFYGKKISLTRGDLLGILFVFEFADALSGKAVIPLVDLSYRKYISKVCEGLNEDIQSRAKKAFQELIYKVSDIYLEWIERVKARYPQVEVEILHERNRKLCGIYDNGRQPYLKDDRKVNEVTADVLRRESVLDYVTMPTLPFYIWGIRDIVQVDCIAEVDAFRRCRRLHGKDIRLCGIFYPETFSLDGRYSNYSAKFINKDYVWMESFDFEGYGG